MVITNHPFLNLDLLGTFWCIAGTCAQVVALSPTSSSLRKGMWMEKMNSKSLPFSRWVNISQAWISQEGVCWIEWSSCLGLDLDSLETDVQVSSRIMAISAERALSMIAPLLTNLLFWIIKIHLPISFQIPSSCNELCYRMIGKTLIGHILFPETSTEMDKAEYRIIRIFRVTKC